MATRKELSLRIIERLEERTKGSKPCSVCGQDDWMVQAKFAAITLTKDANRLVLGGESMPTVPLICTNCGNTHFLNLLVLGFKLEELRVDDEPAE
jgi:hypothetical protein